MHYTVEDYLRNIPVEKIEDFLSRYQQGLIREDYDYAIDGLKQVAQMRKANQELNKAGFWGESGPTVIGVAERKEKK